MKNVLIVSKTEKSAQVLQGMLEQAGYTSFCFAKDTESTKKMLEQTDFKLVVINTPLEDEAGLDLSVYLISHTKAGVLLLTTPQVLEQAGHRLNQKGVFTLEKPLSKILFAKTIQVWETTQNRLHGLEQENEQLKMQVEEINLIHRAKLTLMQCLAMSEPQAHRYLEKQSMDLRLSKKKIAEQVLNTYEV